MDSGASCHVVGSGDILKDPATSNETIKVGDDTIMKATKQGTLMIQAESGATIKLTRVQVVPGIAKYIMSTGSLAAQGNTVSQYQSSNDKLQIAGLEFRQASLQLQNAQVVIQNFESKLMAKKLEMDGISSLMEAASHMARATNSWEINTKHANRR